MRSTNLTAFSNSSKSLSKINTCKLKEITKSQHNHNTKKSNNKLYERLHNEAKELKEKNEIKQLIINENLIKKSTPKIDEVSQKIDRKQKLFPERLYPFHKLNKVDTDEDILFEYAHVASVRSNPIGISNEFDNEDLKNNLDNIFCDDEEIKNLYGNKPSCVKIYRGIKYFKQEKFPFHPSLNKNTYKIAENLGSSKESIFKKCLSSSIDENFNKYRTYKNLNFDEKKILKSKEKKIKILNYFENPNLMENNGNKIEKSNSYSINYNLLKKKNDDHKLNTKSIKISHDIYTKGINMLKRKEILTEDKKKSETVEINKLSFSPNINKIMKKKSEVNSKSFIFNSNNSSTDFFTNNKKNCNNNLYRSPSTNFNSLNNFPSKVKKTRKFNFSSEEYKTFHQSSYETSLINSLNLTPRKSKSIINEKEKNCDFNTSFYEKTKKWKENKEAKNLKLKEKKSYEEFIKCSFSPSIIKKQFNFFNEILEINSPENLYVTRRLNSIEKQEKNKTYQNKIFIENAKVGKIKITKPQEFNFNQLSSRKCKENSNKAKILHRAESVKNYRDMLNTNFFFKQAIYEIEENIESK